MGKKKKTTTTNYVTTTVKTSVVKLSYLQTLAILNELADVKQLETSTLFTPGGGSQEEGANNGVGEFLDSIDIFGSIGSDIFGSTKTTVSSESESSGQQVKDQWLQPEFDRIRYAIGIKEMTAAAYEFAAKSEFVSVPFASPKEIIKVHVIADAYIPPQFDQNETWIEYYIKPEGAEKWIRVNPLNSPTKFNVNGEIIPKIINFNIPKPSTAQLEDKYQTTETPTRSFRFRAVMRRPQGGALDSMTPLLKSYRLIMTPRA